MPSMLSTLAALSVLASPLAAQSRAVNLTGHPIATLDEPFTAISGLVEMPDTRVVVLDAPERRLLMVTFSSGTTIPIGRQGRGPGEWQLPLALFRGKGSQAILGDPGLSKLHLIHPDGRIVGAILPPADDPLVKAGMTLSRGADTLGRLFFQAIPAFNEDGMPDSAEIVRFDPASKQSQVMGNIPVRTNGRTGATRVRTPPMAATDAWAALPDGRVAIVRARPYRVDIASGPNRVHHGAIVRYTPIRIDKAERDAYRSRLASAPPPMRLEIGGPGGARASAARRDTPTIPDEDFPADMPPFLTRNDVRVTPEGEIWVLRSRAHNDPTPTYDIFSSTGQLVAKATLKPNSMVVGFGTGVVYVARQDPSDDLRYLEKYAR